MRVHQIGPRRDRLEGVAAACAFLSNLWLRPEAGAVAAASLTHELLADWPIDRDPDTAAGLDLLARVVETEVDHGELERDYRRLFLGPGPALANPFESVHLSEEGLTFDLQTQQVRAAYRRLGLTAPQLNREPDDHIGLELAFIGEVALAAADAVDRLDAEAMAVLVPAGAEFLTEHLLRWAPGFATLVIEHARTELHRGCGYLLRGALPHWVETFGEVPSASTPRPAR